LSPVEWTMAWHFTHTISDRDSVRKALQLACSRRINSRMTHETAPSGKWITRHPALRHVAVVLEPIG